MGSEFLRMNDHISSDQQLSMTYSLNELSRKYQPRAMSMNNQMKRARSRGNNDHHAALRTQPVIESKLT